MCVLVDEPLLESISTHIVWCVEHYDRRTRILHHLDDRRLWVADDEPAVMWTVSCCLDPTISVCQHTANSFRQVVMYLSASYIRHDLVVIPM